MARLDTGWHAHPKILRLGWAAMGLHAWSISYCDYALTDGFIPFRAWPSLPGAAAAVKRLCEVGLWVPEPGGYRLHDYTDYNRTRARVESVRAAMRANGQAGGRASAQAKSKQSANQTVKQKPTPGPGDVNSSFVRPSVRNLSDGQSEIAATRAPARAPVCETALPAEVVARLNRAPIAERLTNERTNERRVVHTELHAP